MSVSVDTLLNPISADNPCGVDIGYDPMFVELETMLQGKPETQFSASEEPNWKAILERCLELFGRSKDLRVAVQLALALLKTEGLPGFRDGLLVIKGLVERYWEPVHPRLDPDDGNDPQDRVNIIANLAAPAGAFRDPFQFIARIRQVPIGEVPKIGRISLADIERSGSASGGGGASDLSRSQIEVALRSSNPDRLRETYGVIVEAQGAVKQIDALLTKAVGAGRAVAFDELAKVLKELEKTLAPPAAPGQSGDGAGESAGSTGSAGEGLAKGSAISGNVRSTQDVVRVLDQICEFYRRTEPSSPVPLILQRARRLVNMDFVQLLSDLAPDSLTQINVIAGIRPGEGASGGSGG